MRWGLVAIVLGSVAVRLCAVHLALASGAGLLACAAAGMAAGAAEEAMAERRKRRRYAREKESAGGGAISKESDAMKERIAGAERPMKREQEEPAVETFIRHQEARQARDARSLNLLAVEYRPGRGRLH